MFVKNWGEVCCFHAFLGWLLVGCFIRFKTGVGGETIAKELRERKCAYDGDGV